MRGLLIEKGILTADEIREAVERMDARGPHLGARALTRAWVDPVVCTLCSYYPRMVLGIPPDWYKSRAYRSRAVSEPRAVLAEFGTHLPNHTAVRVHDSTADMRHRVLPMRPAGTEGFDEARLAALVTRDALVGVTTL